MRIFIICLLGVMLTGCQQMQEQRRAEAEKTKREDIDKCRHGGTGITGERAITRENAIAYFDCIADANMKFGYAVSPSTIWILENNIAEDRESAVKYAEGKISRQELITETKKHFAEGAKTEAEFNQQQRQQNTQNLMAIQGMLPKPAPAPQPYMVPTNPTVNTNCNVIGNSVDCTSR